jgi:hypothetical protein
VQVRREIDYQTDTSMLSAAWEPFRDNESDVLGYWVSIGSSIGGGELLPKQWVGQQQFVSYHVADANTTWGTDVLTQLPTGIRFFTTVTALNGVGAVSTISSDGVVVDVTAPFMQYVIDGVSTGRGALDDIDQNVYTDILLGGWQAIDDESELIEYEWAISSIGPCERGDLGSWERGNCSDYGQEIPVVVDEASVLDVQLWVNVGSKTLFGRFGLELIEDHRYYIGARAINGAGLRSPPMWSDGCEIKPEGEALLSDDEPVAMMFDVGPMEGSDLDAGTDARATKPPSTFGSLKIPPGAAAGDGNSTTRIRTSKKPDLPAEMQTEDTKPANNLRFGNYSFSIDAEDGESGEHQEGYHFSVPITITVAYNVDLMTSQEQGTSSAAAKIPLELVPQLLLWDVVEERWMYAYETCSPPWHEIDRATQTYSVHVCHLTLYTLGIQAAPVASYCITCIDEKAMIPEGENGYRAHQNVSINSTSYDPVITDGEVSYAPIVSYEWALLRAPSEAYDSDGSTNITGVTMELLDEVGSDGAGRMVMLPKAPDHEEIAPQAGKAGAIGGSQVTMHGLDHRGVYAFRLTVTDTDYVKSSTVVEVVANFFPNASAGADSYADVGTVVSAPPPAPVGAPAPAPLSRVFAGTGGGVMVLLDGSASVDPDFNESLAYEWRLSSSVVPPQVQSSDLPLLIPEWQGTTETLGVLLPTGIGTYTFELTVTDKAGLRNVDTATYFVCPNLQRKAADFSYNCPPISVPLAHFVKPVGADEYILLVAEQSIDVDSSLSELEYEWTQTDGPTRVTIEQASNTSNRPWEGFIARPHSGADSFKGAGGVQNGGEYLFWSGEEQKFEFDLQVFDAWGDSTTNKVSLSTYPPQHNPYKMAALIIFGILFAIMVKLAIVHWYVKKKIRAGKDGWRRETLTDIVPPKLKDEDGDRRNSFLHEAHMTHDGELGLAGFKSAKTGKLVKKRTAHGSNADLFMEPDTMDGGGFSNPMMSSARQAKMEATHAAHTVADTKEELKQRLKHAKEVAAKKILDDGATIEDVRKESHHKDDLAKKNKKGDPLDYYKGAGGDHHGHHGHGGHGHHGHGGHGHHGHGHHTKHTFRAMKSAHDAHVDKETTDTLSNMPDDTNRSTIVQLDSPADNGEIDEMVDAATGHKYYYNKVTQKTSWTKAEVTRKARQRGWSNFGAASGASAKAGKTQQSGANPLFGASHKGVAIKELDEDHPTNPMHGLPENADTGATDSHNARSKKQEKKEAKAKAKAHKIEEAAAVSAGADVDDGEIEVKVDPQSGQKYYYNTVTQKTAWTRAGVQRETRGRGWSSLGSSGGAGAVEASTENSNPLFAMQHKGKKGKTQQQKL